MYNTHRGETMELAKQIKKYRIEYGLSQDELAEKLYVSRQTISNWENEKNYPGIKSILLMSYIFNISVDELVKGDMEDVKELIFKEDMDNFEKYSTIMTVGMFICVISLWPLLHFMELWGIAAWAIIWLITMFYALKVEKYKNKFNIHTYKEIDAFYRGKRLNEAEKNQEYGKRKYQKLLLGVGAGVITLSVAVIFAFLFGDI